MIGQSIKISELETAALINNDSLIPGVVMGTTKKIPYSLLKAKLAEDLGVVNIVLTQTLTAGETTLIFEHYKIGDENTTIEIYADKYGIYPYNILEEEGKITLTFGIQDENISVKVIIANAGLEVGG